MQIAYNCRQTAYNCILNSAMPLKFTKNQTLILNLLFNRPEKSLYMREIGRLLGKEPGVFQKDINNLEKQEILTSCYRGSSRFFELNKNYPLYKEIKNIILKTAGIPLILKRCLNEIEGIKKAFIFGSFASGTQDEYSDIDLIIVSKNINENQLISAINKIENQFKREINYILMTPQEFDERKKSEDQFLDDILKKRIINLI